LLLLGGRPYDAPLILRVDYEHLLLPELQQVPHGLFVWFGIHVECPSISPAFGERHGSTKHRSWLGSAAGLGSMIPGTRHSALSLLVAQWSVATIRRMRVRNRARQPPKDVALIGPCHATKLVAGQGAASHEPQYRPGRDIEVGCYLSKRQELVHHLRSLSASEVIRASSVRDVREGIPP